MGSRIRRRQPENGVIRDAVIVGVSVALAIAAASTGVFHKLVTSSGIPSAMLSLVAGVLYSSIFTVVPATVAITQLASVAPIGEVVVLAGIGAMVGDAVVFRFFRGAFSVWVTSHRQSRFRYWRKRLRWWAVLAGAFIIASPLPDEIGVALLGLTPLQQRWFFPLAFALNSLGIFVIVIAVKFG